MDRHQILELFCNRCTNMRRWWLWPPKNTAGTWITRCSARGRNQYTARYGATCDSPQRGAVSLTHFYGHLLRQSAAKSVLLLFSSQLDGHEAEESTVERAWFKLERFSCSSA